MSVHDMQKIGEHDFSREDLRSRSWSVQKLHNLYQREVGKWWWVEKGGSVPGAEEEG